ncbi:GntR family transcriptional regulator [Agrobacterium cavarae]
MASTDHHVYLSIREQIFDGRLAPNSFINVQSLAELHKVSALPVREALIRLAAEDLVEYTKSRGFMTSLINLSTLADSYEIVYQLFQSSVRSNIASKSVKSRIDCSPIQHVFENRVVTAKDVEDALELFASTLMREHFYSCFLRELRRTRPFRYQTFNLRNDIAETIKYVRSMKELVLKQDYKAIYRSTKSFYEYNSSNLMDLYQDYVQRQRRNKVYNDYIS